MGAVHDAEGRGRGVSRGAMATLVGKVGSRRLRVIQMHLGSHCMRKGLVGEWDVLVCGHVTRGI